MIAALHDEHDEHASESIRIAYEHYSLVTVTALTVTALRPVLIAYKHVLLGAHPGTELTVSGTICAPAKGV